MEDKCLSICDVLDKMVEGEKIIITRTADGIKTQGYEEYENEIKRLMEINEAHHKFNGELMAKVDKLVADKVKLIDKLEKITLMMN